ncbi:haloacid dehalogenase-like hydrolase [bacterium]|nr:MAG: haloacid dehalogenase-like hydrolase [bacterium]
MKPTLGFLVLLVSISCIAPSGAPDAMADPLPSWSDGVTRQRIIEFVTTVTDPENPGFVPVEERIATFDNDGTLWSEQPVYFQLAFAIDRVSAMASEHPEWKQEEPFKSVLQSDLGALTGMDMHDLMTLLMASHAGMTTAEFREIVHEWLSTARHPQLDRPYTELVYQPMLELLDYLRDNGFETWIVSGGGVEFMRPWVEEVYGIPPQQVVGSRLKTEFRMTSDGPRLVRLPEIDFIDDKEGKPVAINHIIGRRPIAAFGNSDGDLQMLQWTAAGDGERLMVYVHHTDADREWAYDRDSHIGRLDRGLTEAAKNGWTVIDMQDDWLQIYPNE